MPFKEKIGYDPSHMLIKVLEAMHPPVGSALVGRDFPQVLAAEISGASGRVWVREIVPCLLPHHHHPRISSVVLTCCQPAHS